MRKKNRLLRSQLNRIVRQAAKEARDEKEICGLLIDNGYFIEVVQTENKIKKGGRCAYYYKEVRAIVSAAEKLGHEVVGTFHSHPFSFAKPGENDIENAIDDSLMLVINATDKKTALWHIKNKRSKQLRFVLLDEKTKK